MDKSKKSEDIEPSSDGWNQWIIKNLLLITTLIGVIIGTSAGSLKEIILHTHSH